MLGWSSSQYWVNSCPIIYAVLALRSWNYCSGEQGLTAQHLYIYILFSCIKMIVQSCWYFGLLGLCSSEQLFQLSSTETTQTITEFVLSHLWPLKTSLIGTHTAFSHMPTTTVEIVQTCVSINNTNAYDVLSDSHKYFTYDNHTVSLTLMII